MRPSDKVWDSINKRLNRKKRRFGFLVSFSLMAAAGLGYFLYTAPDNGRHATATNNAATNANPARSATGAASNSTGSTLDLNTTAPPTPTPQIISGPAHTTAQAHASSTANSRTRINTGRRHASSTALTGNRINTGSPIAAADAFIPTVVDSYDENLLNEQTAIAKSAKKATDPLTIESVVNLYHPRASRVNFQVYFTPTFSYRKLHDENIANVVTHKPDFGFEIGFSARYPVSKHLRVLGGLQFNVNRYDIKTFNSTPQNATIRLRNGVDSLSAATSYNNFSGYRSNWLENFFFQISAPVGVELRLRGNNRTQIGIATTIQPTYVLGDRAYVISSDYKNYAEVPRLISRWNMNTSLETFVAYGTGRLKWQVGPQVRYQVFSTYDRKYPVKENLFDFGLKVGISLNQ